MRVSTPYRDPAEQQEQACCEQVIKVARYAHGM